MPAGSFVYVVNGGGESKWRLVTALTISLVLPHVICVAASIKMGNDIKLEASKSLRLYGETKHLDL